MSDEQAVKELGVQTFGVNKAQQKLIKILLRKILHLEDSIESAFERIETLETGSTPLKNHKMIDDHSNHSNHSPKQLRS